MAPQCFPPYANQNQAVSAVQQHEATVRLHRAPPPLRIPPGCPVPPGFQRVTSNARQIGPPARGPRPMHPLPPRQLPPGLKGRPFPLRPPMRRMPQFANGRPRHHPQQQILINNGPPLRRSMPPLHLRPHPRPQMAGSTGPVSAALGLPRPQAPAPSVPAAPSSNSQSPTSQSPSTQIPLRELHNQNIVPPVPQSSNMLVEKPQQETQGKDPQSAPSKKQRADDTDAAEILLGLRALSTPTPPPVSPTEKDNAKIETTPELKPDEPMKLPDSLPTRLAVAEDESKLNSMHCFLRSDLLELFVVESSRNAKNCSESAANAANKLGYKIGSASGRVGLRCVHCAKARVKKNLSSDGEAPMAVFYPKSISELYRLVTSWQRVHLRKCHNLPPSVRETYEKTREDKSRGKTQWWVDSARQIGLIDCRMKAGGIRFASAPNGLLGGI